MTASCHDTLKKNFRTSWQQLEDSFKLCWQQLDYSLQRDIELALFAAFVWNQVLGRFCLRYSPFLTGKSLSICWSLDPNNEAKVSNFRDVVSVALPFEGETGEVLKIRAFLSFWEKRYLKPFLRSSITLQLLCFIHVFYICTTLYVSGNYNQGGVPCTMWQSQDVHQATITIWME